MFKQIKTLIRKFKPKTLTIEDKNGNILWEQEKVLERWREYCTELYQEEPTALQDEALPRLVRNQQEPNIIRTEVEHAIKYLKSNKAPEPDNITAEVLRALGHDGADIILDLCNKIWQTGQWPKDWTQSIFIPIHKKGSIQKCQNHRIISLISHASKVLLRIIDQRLKYYLKPQIPPEQASLVKGRGTREQIFNIRQIIEKAQEFNSPMVLCFIDYKKVFDYVRWNSLWKILMEMGVPHHLVHLVRSLYKTHEGTVLESNVSKPFNIQKGV